MQYLNYWNIVQRSKWNVSTFQGMSKPCVMFWMHAYTWTTITTITFKVTNMNLNWQLGKFGHLLVLANLHIKFEDSRSKHTKVLTTLTYLHPRSQWPRPSNEWPWNDQWSSKCACKPSCQVWRLYVQAYQSYNNFNILTFKVTVTLTFKWMTLKWPVVIF